MANAEIKNKAYDENGMPVNLEIRKYPNEEYAKLVWFVNLPNSKYFDEGTWNIFIGKNIHSARINEAPECFGWSRIPFSELTKDAQAFVLRYYEDTFGRPDEIIK